MASPLPQECPSENAKAFKRQRHTQRSEQEDHHDVEDGTLGLRNPTPPCWSSFASKIHV